MTEANLWKQFNLAENSPDPAGGILYATRRSEEALEAAREKVIQALQEMGATCSDTGVGLGVQLPPVQIKEGGQKFIHLVEELSVLNEALEYRAKFAPILDNGLAQFCNQLTANLCSREALEDKVNTYNMVSLFIPRLVAELQFAKRQGHQFTAAEEGAINSLESHARRVQKLLDSPGGMVVIG